MVGINIYSYKMSETYLVTGATGFVGSNIVRRLVGEKKDVHILTRNRKLNWRISDISSKLTIHEVDLLSPKLLKVIDEVKPSYIFHLAVYGSLPEEKDLKNLVNTNILGTVNLINAVKRNKFILFINTGSSSEYGIKSRKMRETDLLVPINDYGVIKSVSTLYASKEAVRENLPIITFRLFSPYGPYEEGSRLIPYMVCQALTNKSIKLASRSYVRDFTYIDDVVNAYIKACDLIPNPGEIFNIATGRQHSVKEVVDIVLEKTHSISKIEWGKAPAQERQLEPKVWEADTAKSKKILGFSAKHSLAEGLEKTILWFRKNINLYE